MTTTDTKKINAYADAHFDWIMASVRGDVVAEKVAETRVNKIKASFKTMEEYNEAIGIAVERLKKEIGD